MHRAWSAHARGVYIGHELARVCTFVEVGRVVVGPHPNGSVRHDDDTCVCIVKACVKLNKTSWLLFTYYSCTYYENKSELENPQSFLIGSRNHHSQMNGRNVTKMASWTRWWFGGNSRSTWLVTSGCSWLDVRWWFVFGHRWRQDKAWWWSTSVAWRKIRRRVLLSTRRHWIGERGRVCESSSCQPFVWRHVSIRRVGWAYFVLDGYIFQNYASIILRQQKYFTSSYLVSARV